MKDINRIDIYVGEVGTAYVDNETAIKNLAAAKKNIKDMKDIIHDAGEALDGENEPTDGAKQKVEKAIQHASAAQGTAGEVSEKLQDAIDSLEDSDPKKDLLIKLQTALSENDTDGIGLNGGNTATADQNLEELESQLQKIQDIINEALDQLNRLTEVKTKYEKAARTAQSAFDSYIPEDVIDDNNEESDAIETNLNRRITAVLNAINYAENVTTAINETSSEYKDRIKDIVPGIFDEETEPDPQVTTFTVTLIVEHGDSVEGSQVQTVNENATATWTITPSNGFKLPETVTNGTISNGVVTSIPVTADMTVTVVCEEIEEQGGEEPQNTWQLYISPDQPNAVEDIQAEVQTSPYTYVNDAERSYLYIASNKEITVIMDGSGIGEITTSQVGTIGDFTIYKTEGGIATGGQLIISIQ